MIGPEFGQIVETVGQNKEILAALGTLVIAAFTEKQRRSIRLRDENKCQVGDIIPHAHGGRLEVHHIIPQAFHYATGSDPDYVENALTICSSAHKRIHPDIERALVEYHSGNKDSFKDMAKQQQQSAYRGEVFWVDKWDAKLIARARKNTLEALRKLWIFPEKGNDGKR